MRTTTERCRATTRTIHAVASKTSIERLVRALDADAVSTSLTDNPDRVHHRDQRGRTWLHLCCSIDIRTRPAATSASIALADHLLTLGLDIDTPAFTEGTWHATPLWYAVAHGRNLALARHLLGHGADPNHCLWAAAFNDDHDAIDLLLDNGAAIDPVTEDETPFLSAIKNSRFAAAWHLARRGADIDIVDPSGRTALHYMLKKASPTDHVVAFAHFRPRVDIPDPSGTTAADLLARRRDPVLRDLATSLTRPRA